MKRIASIIVFLSLCSGVSAQGLIANPNPFLPPPVVPGYQACMGIFDDFLDCQPGWANQGQPQCVAINREYFETLNCPDVFRWQGKVNANAFAGNPPNPIFESRMKNRLR
jgi:hypothetical protein